MRLSGVVKYIKWYILADKRGPKKDNICKNIFMVFENGDIKAESPSNFH